MMKVEWPLRFSRRKSILSQILKGHMKDQDNRITNLIWKEVAAKGVSAAVAFAFFAALIYFYHFNLVIYREAVKTSCLIAIIANALRLWISQKVGPEVIPSEENRNILRLSIWLNSAAWGVVFTLTTLETNAQTFEFTLMVTLMTGFLSSSIITLAYDKTLFFPFQLLILIPVISITTYQYLSGRNPVGLYLAIFLTFYIFYQFKQYRTYQGQLMERFSYQIQLEESYEELKISQQAFVNQTAKLMHASKISALVEMAGGLAHEVNNSLMVILGSTQQIERQLKSSGLLDPGVKKKVNQSLDSILKIKNVIQGLKQFSQQLEPSLKSNISLKKVVEQSLPYYQELLTAHAIDFQIDPIPDVTINCHPFQIIQIIFNITKNADDVVSSASKEKRWIRFEFVVDNNYVLMKIKNGGTISPDTISRLFQPFFTTKDVGKGTGLSLSISKGFALENKGDLYFEPDQEVTTFTLRLPLA